jgi:outer membrane protein assembly factor BamE (lipoprotein component of BamABCDE complex)
MSLRAPRLARIVLAAATIASLSACARIRDHDGYVADSTLIEAIQPGVDNRDSVARTLGRPSFEAQFDKNPVWYYVARDTRQLGYQRPRPVAQTTLAVKFDPAGNVTAIEKSGLEKVVKVDVHGDKTPTLGRERGFFAELFGNIGRVGAVGPGGGTADNPN